eukprot:tig00021621_g22988.t1
MVRCVIDGPAPPADQAPTLAVGPAPDSLSALGVLAPHQLHRRPAAGGSLHVRLLNPANEPVLLPAGAVVAVAEANNLPPGDFGYDPPPDDAPVRAVADTFIRTLRAFYPKRGQGFRSMRRRANRTAAAYMAAEGAPTPQHPAPGPIFAAPAARQSDATAATGQEPAPSAPPLFVRMMRDDDDEGHEVPIVTMEGLALHDEPVSSDTDSELERDVGYPGWTSPEERERTRPARRAERAARRRARAARVARQGANVVPTNPSGDQINLAADAAEQPAPAPSTAAARPATAPAPLDGPGCSVRTTDAPGAPSAAESSAARGKDKGKAPLRAAPPGPAPGPSHGGPPRAPPETTGTSSSEEEEWNRARAKIPECGSHPAMSTAERAELEALLKRYSCAFADSVTATEGTANLLHYEHVIRLTSRLPVFTPPRRVSPHAEAFARAEIKRLLELGLIQPSQAAYGSPVVLAPKKDGTWRFCVDYRRLNAITERDVFPLPRIDDQLDRLRGSMIFSTVDATAGFWQLPLDPASRQYTAFVVPWGHYEWRVTPFGVTNGPAAFSRAVTAILGPLLTTCVTAYIDDITVFSPSVPQHLLDLEALFRAIMPANLRLKPSKCRFGVAEVALLGHLVSAEGIRQDPAKLAFIRQYPPPANADQLRSFLGLAGYYRRFVNGFARVTHPLQRLLLRDAVWQWTEVHQAAFEALKAALLEDLVLGYPDFERPFILSTDASTYAIGAILSQSDGGSPARERPIAFISRTLAPAERNYTATELECLAVVWAIKYWRHFLLGGPQFLVRTDHQALQWLRSREATSGRLGRWSLLLQSYDFVVEYRAGRNNGGPDACSRPPLNHPVLAPGGADGSSAAPDALAGAAGHGVPQPGDLDEPLPLFAVALGAEGAADARVAVEAPPGPRLTELADEPDEAALPGPAHAPGPPRPKRRRPRRVGRRSSSRGDRPVSGASSPSRALPPRGETAAPADAEDEPQGAPAPPEPRAPAAGQEAPLPAALQLPQAGPPTRRGRKPTTWAAMRQEVDEWHRLAVEQGLPPAPRSPSPPPAPEADPWSWAPMARTGSPLPSSIAYAAGSRRDRGATRGLSRPCRATSDDPDEGPEGGAPAASSSAAASTTAATAGSSEPPAAPEAPSSGDAGSSGGPAAGLERELLSSSAIAPGPELGEVRDRRKPRLLELVQDTWDCAPPPSLDGPLPEALRHMFPARRVRLLAAQKADSLCRKLFSWHENGVNEARCTRASCQTGDCYLCNGVLDRVLYAYHDGWGHRGASIVARRILLRFWWPGMLAAVARYVRSCHCCQFAKAVKPRRTAIAVIEAEGRNDLWQVDVFHLDPTPRGNRYLVAWVNAWDKYTRLYPKADLDGWSMLEMGRDFVSNEGVPLRLLMDNGSSLKGGPFNEYFRKLGTRFIYAAAYHHSTNGLVERLGGVVKTLLHAACRAEREPMHEWDQHVHEVQLALRTTVHAATGYSPALLHLGHELTLPADVRFGVEMLDTLSYADYVSIVVRSAKSREAAVREYRRWYRRQMVHRTGDLPDRRRFGVGDKVLCWLGDRDKGLFNSWVGPFTVMSVHPGGYTYVVRGLARPYGAVGAGRQKARDTRETIVHIDCMIPFRVRDANAPARPARGGPRRRVGRLPRPQRRRLRRERLKGKPAPSRVPTPREGKDMRAAALAPWQR